MFDVDEWGRVILVERVFFKRFVGFDDGDDDDKVDVFVEFVKLRRPCFPPDFVPVGVVGIVDEDDFSSGLIIHQDDFPAPSL